MKKLLLILLVVAFIPFNSFCQRDYELMFNDYSINFYDVCNKADEYFKENDKNIRGSGWKKYQRWRNANEYKYYPDGNRKNIDPYFTVNSYKDFISNNFSPVNLLNGWKELGPVIVDSCNGGYNPGLGRVVCFYVDPANEDNICLGSRSGGFWKTNNGGNTWDNSTDFLFASGVNTIDASPTNSDSILINVQDASNGISHGIYRSIDAGDTWNVTNFNPTNLGLGGLGSYFYISRIAYHPTIPNLIFIRTSAGLYRSDDNLQSWSLIPTSISKFEFHPNNPNIMYAYSGNSFYISNDAGSSFNLQSTMPVAPSFISLSSDCSNCIYLLSSYDGMWKSLDQGVNFTFMDSCIIPSYANWKGGFAVNDIDTSNIIYGGTEIMASIDGGQSFNMTTYWNLGSSIHGGGSYSYRLQNSLHYPHADLRCAKNINGTFYVGTDGFLSKSIDNGNTWKILSQGTAIRENYKLGVSQSNTYRSISGSQDNGSSIKHKDTWIEFYGADGMEGLIHPLNHDWMISSLQNGGRRRTKDGGISGNGITCQNGAWEAPITYDPNDQMRIYDFGADIYVSEDFGSNWIYQGSPFTSYINQSAIAENNSDIILVSSGGVIKKSIDGGINFSDISNNLPGDHITDIAFDPNNDEIIIITYATWQNNGDKVYLTTDGGNSWNNITYNLGNMPIHSVVVDHTNSSNIYVGAEIGVYTKAMNSNLWSLYNPLFPNTTVEELEIVYGSNTIKAATWGRGLWEFDLVGRSSFPSILTNNISDMPTDSFPMANTDQYVTSVISYNSILSSVFVEWSINDDTITNIIPMVNIQDSTWVSQNPILNNSVFNRVYFKVFAVGNNNDTSETYQFMYKIRPDCYSPASAVFSTSNVSCFGGNDGSSSISISGGTGPFSYLWFNGQSTQSVNNLQAGNYSCTVTDFNGCVLSSSFIITEPSELSPFIYSSNISCYGGNDGSSGISILGGTGPFMYLWSNGQSTQIVNNLQAGNYSCIVTDFNGCTTSDSIYIIDPSLITIIDTVTDVSCSAVDDGSIDLTIFGGTPCMSVIKVGLDTIPSYESYLWYTWYMDGNTQITYLASELAAVGINPGDIMTGLAWRIVSQDGSASSIIMNNAQMKVNGTVVYSGNYQAVLGMNNFIFNNSMIYNGGDLVVEWCFDNNNYLWGNNYFESSMITGTLGSFADLSTSSGCTFLSASTIYSYRPNLYITTPTSNEYTYNWSNGDTTEDLSTLISGQYSCIVTDCNGCQETSNFTVNQTNTALNASISETNSNLLVTISNGTPPYSYEWSTNATTQSIVPLANGIYWAIATDTIGCVSDTVFFNVTWINTSVESINIINLNIFPNPSNDEFNIEFSSLISQNLKIRLVNSVGDVIFIDNLINYSGEYKNKVNLKEFSKAIYLLEIQTDDGVVNKKLMLQ